MNFMKSVQDNKKVKLTDRQKEYVRKMRDGWVMYWQQGTRESYYVFRNKTDGHEWLNKNVINQLAKKGIIHYGELDASWHSRPYHLTELGKTIQL